MHSSIHSARDIIAHISNLHGPIKIKCKVCGLLFNSKWEFQWHKYDYHKPIECPICHVKFQDDKTLSQHLRNRNEKTTLCPIDETRPKLARTIPPAPVAPPEQHLAFALMNPADVPIEGVNLAYENGLADDVDGLDVNVAIGPAVIENIRTNERTLEKVIWTDLIIRVQERKKKTTLYLYWDLYISSLLYSSSLIIGLLCDNGIAGWLFDSLQPLQRLAFRGPFFHLFKTSPIIKNLCGRSIAGDLRLFCQYVC